MNVLNFTPGGWIQGREDWGGGGGSDEKVLKRGAFASMCVSFSPPFEVGGGGGPVKRKEGCPLLDSPLIPTGAPYYNTYVYMDAHRSNWP